MHMDPARGTEVSPAPSHKARAATAPPAEIHTGMGAGNGGCVFYSVVPAGVLEESRYGVFYVAIDKRPLQIRLRSFFIYNSPRWGINVIELMQRM